MNFLSFALREGAVRSELCAGSLYVTLEGYNAGGVKLRRATLVDRRRRILMNCSFLLLELTTRAPRHTPGGLAFSPF